MEDYRRVGGGHGESRRTHCRAHRRARVWSRSLASGDALRISAQLYWVCIAVELAEKTLASRQSVRRIPDVLCSGTVIYVAVSGRRSLSGAAADASCHQRGDVHDWLGHLLTSSLSLCRIIGWCSWRTVLRWRGRP